MSFKGIMSSDQNDNYPNAAFEALKKRRLKERNEIINKAKQAENTSNLTLKNRMAPHKNSLRPKKVV